MWSLWQTTKHWKHVCNWKKKHCLLHSIPHFVHSTTRFIWSITLFNFFFIMSVPNQNRFMRIWKKNLVKIISVKRRNNNEYQSEKKNHLTWMNCAIITARDIRSLIMPCCQKKRNTSLTRFSLSNIFRSQIYSFVVFFCAIAIFDCCFNSFSTQKIT